jgi:hypothetical protein
MKALKMLLKSEKVKTASLRVLFEQDGATTFALTTDGWDVLDLWLKLRDLAPRTGRWPLLVDDGYPTNRAQFIVGGKEPKTPHYQTILDEAEGIDFADWLSGCRQSHLEMIRGEADLEHPERDDDDVRHYRSLLRGDEEFHGIYRGKWPTNVGPDTFEGIAATTKFVFEPHMRAKRVTLALLPAPEGWKAPAFMKWGGWNACHKPALHCSALRYWEREWGAELVAMTRDTLEPRVARPPKSRLGAMRLARAHFHYCPDRVHQQEGSLEGLAAKLLNADAWSFWWD